MTVNDVLGSEIGFWLTTHLFQPLYELFAGHAVVRYSSDYNVRLQAFQFYIEKTIRMLDKTFFRNSSRKKTKGVR
jgi:hypothetical protein